jgi:glycosyltransferase involved in cell wall biosynthesis
MRILFVAFPYSVHAARWTSLLAETGWDLHLFGAQPNDQLHELFREITFWPVNHELVPSHVHASVRVRPRSTISGAFGDEVDRLLAVMDAVRPDIVHSMEFQHASYLVLDAKARRRRFPIWIATNWGCDIYWYRRQEDHCARISRVLAEADFYSCECQRDVGLARQIGLSAEPLPVVPNSGGFDLNRIELLRGNVPPSLRRVIAVKGYDFGLQRARHAFDALERCIDLLAGYSVRIYSPTPADAVGARAARLRGMGLTIDCMPIVSHDEMLKLHASARVSMAISLADGICTSLLEAMAMGSYPIQSNTACAEEWITDGATGSIVDPEQPDKIADALHRTLHDDALVDRAAGVNQHIIRSRANRESVRATAIHRYYEHARQRARTQSWMGPLQRLIGR